MKTANAGGRWLLGLTLLLLLVRLLSLGTYPLLDTTEARYGYIGQHMAAIGDWITPWYPGNLPFWGKPPLSFWLTALSFKTFGVNEFTARLPHFLLGVLALALLWQWFARYGRPAALYGVAILSGSALFLAAAGIVETDMSLTLSAVLVMRGFWLGLYGDTACERRREGWLMFVGLGLGLLAKGPLILVFAGLSGGAWFLLSGETFGRVWRELPWLRGIALMLLIAVPWYVLAERKTPGFIDYFIVGEHFSRFVTPGWKGDMYGHAHHEPVGMVWAYTWAGFLPWALILPLLAWRGRRQSAVTADAQLIRYLLAWGLVPCVFFTLSRNIIPTYGLPGIPALALAAGYWLANRPAGERNEPWIAGGLLFSIALAVAVPLVINHGDHAERKSMKALVVEYRAQQHADAPLYVLSNNSLFSYAFYSDGKALKVDDVPTLLAVLGPGAAYVAMAPSIPEKLPPTLQQRLHPLGLHGEFRLYAVDAIAPADAAPGTRPASAALPPPALLPPTPAGASSTGH